MGNEKQKELMKRLAEFWAANPVMTSAMVELFDGDWLKLTRENKKILIQKWGLNSEKAVLTLIKGGK